MKHLIVILLLLQSCKKDTNTITYVMTKGAGDVVVTAGELTTDFQACPEGWTYTVEAQPATRYTIWTQAHKVRRGVAIRYNGKTVASDSVFAVFKTP
jgi:hypothetical protein